MGNLLSSSAVPPTKSRPGLEILHSVIKTGNIDSLNELLADKSLVPVDLVYALNDRGVTALHVAAENGRLKCVLHLLEKYGASPYIEDKSGMTPLHVAATEGHVKIAQALLCHTEKLGFLNLNEKDNWGYTALHRAVIHCRWNVAEFLLDFGANVKIADKTGKIPLHVSVSYGNLSMTRRLLESGSPVNHQDARGRTPLYLATLAGHTSVVEEIALRDECDVNIAGYMGVSPLTQAAQNGNLRCVEVLLQRGACCHTAHLASRVFRFPPVEHALYRAANIRDKEARSTYLQCASLLIQAEGFSPTGVAFYAAHRCLQAEESDKILQIILMLFLAGVKVELQQAVQTGADQLIRKWSRMYSAQCLPLLELCRRQIRHHTQSLHDHSNLVALVDRLGLPKRLTDIVMLRDV